MAEHTIDNPEDGYFWRLLGGSEASRFSAADAASAYGLTKQEALTSCCRVLATCTRLPAEARKILMGTSREYVLQWRAAKDGHAMFLRVPRDRVTESEFEPMGPGVALLGRVAVCSGELVEIGENEQ